MQQIGRKDVIWNFAGTFMRIASGLIVLPLVLHLLPSQEVGLWNIFLTVGSLAALLDFGFSNAFSRNVTYVFSGAKELKQEGYISVSETDSAIDYGLLRSLIAAMRRYYTVLAVIFLIIFLAASPFYLPYIFEKNNYAGDRQAVWIAWLVYGFLVAYQLYTYYYNSLLLGRGYVRKFQQIVIIGQGSRILSSAIFLLLGFGLISLVIGQLLSDIINRVLCYRTFYDKDTRNQMACSSKRSVKEIMHILTPNAVKIGATVIRGFLLYQGIIMIAPLYISLSAIGEFGTTRQFIELISSIGMIIFNTYFPKMTKLRVTDDLLNLKRLWIKSNLFLFIFYLIAGIGFVILGPCFMEVIHSKTHFLSASLTTLFLLISYLEVNSGMATSFLTMKNEVPFFRANLYSGFLAFILVFLLLQFSSLGVAAIILGIGISQGIYQYWKWPLTIRKELHLRTADYIFFLKQVKQKGW
jgi:O-antigen/teichoic acid export membrane protein